MIDWKQLLTDYHIPWRDKGKNTSRKDVNICCPFCGDDTGFHMGISLDNPTNFYCFRGTRAHSGKSYPWLLSALGLNTMEITKVLKEYDNAYAIPEEVPPDPKSITTRWKRFDRASGSISMLTYLLDRGFPDADRVANQFDLRYAAEGKWAQRILFPFYERAEVVSWAGRAIRDSFTPKMLMQDNQHPGLIYTPIRRPKDKGVLIEGQFDALKCAAYREDYFPMALSGKGLTDSKLIRISAVCHTYKIKTLYQVFDADVALSTRTQSLGMLKSALGRSVEVKTLALPRHYEDPGAMPPKVVENWLP
jgi:hypothetical protein